MKRFLLSMVTLACVATGANAQKIGLEIKGNANAGHNTAAMSIAAPASKAYAKKKIKDNEALVGYPGSETPVSYSGWPTVSDAQAVAAQINDAAKIKNLAGYTVVGMRFIVLGNLGADAAAFAWVYDAQGQLKADSEYELKEGQYDLCELDGSNLTVKYNDVYFDSTATFETLTRAHWTPPRSSLARPQRWQTASASSSMAPSTSLKERAGTSMPMTITPTRLASS